MWLLAGDIGARSLTSAPENLPRAAAYIEHVLRGYNYNPRRQEFTVETLSQHDREITSEGIKFPTVRHNTWNVIAEKAGAAGTSGVVIVGAHYDSVYDCPAANDNGSGVAAMLEIARLLGNESLQKTLRFVAFTNEEPPFLERIRWAVMCMLDGATNRKYRSDDLPGDYWILHGFTEHSEVSALFIRTRVS